MRYSIVSLLVIILVMVSFRSPQSVIVKGSVKDANGKALPGVIVTEVGTKNQTITKTNGSFVIVVNSEKSVLEFAPPGFAAIQKAIPPNKLVNLVLPPMLALSPEPVKQPLSKSSNAEMMQDRMAPMVTMEYATRNANSIRGYVPGVITGREHKAYPPGIEIPGKRDKNFNTEDYDGIVENRFLSVDQNPLSTFSIDVDAASYSNVRRYLNDGQLPPSGAVRIEEMINYFHYDYPQPLGDDPFSINTEMSVCPWNGKHQLALVGLQGKKISMEKLPASNLVFLIDVSGSMMGENRLPLVKSSMKLLVDQLREQDMVSIVVYAGNAGLVLTSTSGAEKMKIKDAINKLEAGGSTAGGQGIKLAYKTAVSNFISKGNNRVILCTDGDFNVGVSSDSELENIVEQERKSGVFLTVLGYGMGNYKDNKMQKLADKGNGNHAYIDGINEAKKVLVNEFGGTLFTIAKDVKLQVEFNPAKVQAYRLIGYENRMLQKEDFNNDAKDAGELGSGHTVTALYEIIPVGVKNEFLESVDPLKYQQNVKPKSYVTVNNGEVMNIKFRYKKPDGEISKLIVHPVKETQTVFTNVSSNFSFASAVAEFGMLIRNSEFKQSSSFENTKQLAKNAMGKDEGGYRGEFLELLNKAQSIAGSKVMTEVK